MPFSYPARWGRMPSLSRRFARGGDGYIRAEHGGDARPRVREPGRCTVMALTQRLNEKRSHLKEARMERGLDRASHEKDDLKHDKDELKQENRILRDEVDRGRDERDR